MKRNLLLAATVMALAAPLVAWSQPYGMGPGGGYGPGYGMGPGMMGGWGQGYGMGSGHGMGPGMMGGFAGGGLYGLDLTAEQRDRIADIQQEAAQQRWQLMEQMHAAGRPMYQAFAGGELDEEAARKAYDAMAQARKQMFEASLDTRKRIFAVLTPEQREQLTKSSRGRWQR